jgi:hypothetical protein
MIKRTRKRLVRSRHGEARRMEEPEASGQGSEVRGQKRMKDLDERSQEVENGGRIPADRGRGVLSSDCFSRDGG